MAERNLASPFSRGLTMVQVGAARLSSRADRIAQETIWLSGIEHRYLYRRDWRGDDSGVLVVKLIRDFRRQYGHQETLEAPEFRGPNGRIS